MQWLGLIFTVKTTNCDILSPWLLKLRQEFALEQMFQFIAC